MYRKKTQSVENKSLSKIHTWNLFLLTIFLRNSYFSFHMWFIAAWGPNDCRRALIFFFSFSVYASSFCVFFLCECILWSQFLMFISSICWHYRFSKWFTWIVCLGCVNLFFTLNSLEKICWWESFVFEEKHVTMTIRMIYVNHFQIIYQMRNWLKNLNIKIEHSYFMRQE